MLAVADCKERGFLASHVFLDDDVMASPAQNVFVEHFVHCCESLIYTVADDCSLAGG